jgi:lipoyl(octanoyl) transferase
LQLSQYKWFRAIPDARDSQSAPELIVRRLGMQDYEPIWQAMRYLAEHPRKGRPDEIWLLSHKPVYTQGQAGKAEHILNPGDIPVIQVDRGGQVTYHGPGQLVVYLLIDVRRRNMGVRGLVDLIEQEIISTLASYSIESKTRSGAPGVYVKDAKIAALGLRIKNGWSYHGLSLNVNMDLDPFKNINPCGFEKLEVAQIADYFPAEDHLLQAVSKRLTDALLTGLGYQTHYEKQGRDKSGQEAAK